MMAPSSLGDSGDSAPSLGNRPDSNGDAAGPFAGYGLLPDTFDEVFDRDGSPHPGLGPVVEPLTAIPRREFRRLQKLANDAFLRGGVTFSVHTHGDGDPDRIFPFDLIPRIIARAEWDRVEKGLVQRITALNALLGDVYGDQRILAEGVVPRDMVESSSSWTRPFAGCIRPTACTCTSPASTWSATP